MNSIGLSPAEQLLKKHFYQLKLLFASGFSLLNIFTMVLSMEKYGRTTGNIK